MKILRVIPSMDPSIGGPCQGIRNSIPELTKLGIENEVVCMDAQDADYLGMDSFPIKALGPSKGPWGYCEKLIPHLVSNFHLYNIVIIHGLWQYHSYAVNKAAAIYRKKFPDKATPIIYVMPHGMLDPWFQKAKERRIKAIRNYFFWKFFESDVVNNSDGVLFTCLEELRLARLPFRPYRPKKEINVGYGITAPPAYTTDMDIAFRSACPTLGDDAYLLFLSRIDQKKGVDLLIKAYLLLKQKGISLPKLVIAGPGMETSYGDQLLALASNTTDILFPGMLRGNAKWGAFYGCEAFILPSHQENFGIAVVEAMACEKPVLISDQINIWREIDAGKGGMIEPDNASGAASLIMRWVALSVAEKQIMGKNASNTFQELFTTERAAKQMFQQILQPAKTSNKLS
ncbi:glycosyltransferase [Dyadobacter chenhuakuii]|uniref:Glycosyltransferase n=1 Tax=Dyadobacter chenhuakuii TaxID=2909339 RepID=A0A9X1QJS0_9BACT|nr:glycosyltransferase [Dyadobacter chenhuakuii]MCF2501513.1 glycosyltransferase [Dyadobacter chenhuakuii]